MAMGQLRTATSMLAMLAMFGGASANASSPVVPENLISLWKAEGDASDSVGPHHGEAKNGVTFDSGVRGLAFRFNGLDQYVDIGNPAGLRISGSFTLAAWVKSEGVPSGSGATIIAKWGQNIHTDAYALSLRNDGGLSPNGAVGVWGNCECSAFTGGSMATNVWYHVAMTYDSANGDNRLYINGQLAASRNRYGGTTPSDRPVQIGREGTSANRYFNGLIDEVRVYNRAITMDEIWTIYTAER